MEIDKKSIKETVEEGTPLLENRCECGGEIVKVVNGLSRGQYQYSIPHCNECRKEYMFARDVRIVGHKEFNDMMNESFTM